MSDDWQVDDVTFDRAQRGKGLSSQEAKALAAEIARLREREAQLTEERDGCREEKQIAVKSAMLNRDGRTRAEAHVAALEILLTPDGIRKAAANEARVAELEAALEEIKQTGGTLLIDGFPPPVAHEEEK